MSSHHPRKWFNLHHEQVNAGRVRRLERQAERLRHFLSGREEARFEYQCMLIFGFICFAYTMIATAVYTGYVI